MLFALVLKMEQVRLEEAVKWPVFLFAEEGGNVLNSIDNIKKIIIYILQRLNKLIDT